MTRAPERQAIQTRNVVSSGVRVVLFEAEPALPRLRGVPVGGVRVRVAALGDALLQHRSALGGPWKPEAAPRRLVHCTLRAAARAFLGRPPGGIPLCEFGQRDSVLERWAWYRSVVTILARVKRLSLGLNQVLLRTECRDFAMHSPNKQREHRRV